MVADTHLLLKILFYSVNTIVQKARSICKYQIFFVSLHVQTFVQQYYGGSLSRN